ncbi:MAG TPA: metal ABC transporter ATP-binding protein [Acidimicrobiales bacterium]
MHAVLAHDLVLAHGSHAVAVDRASFEIPVGASVSFVGPNGSGKSTLLAALAGLLTPRSGRLDVPAHRRRAGVALVLQTTHVDRSLPITVRETVTMARYARRGVFGRLRRADHAAVEAALDRVGMAGVSGRQLDELSGGQRQRVLVAQGLAQGAELLLLDEPTTGLDLLSQELITGAIAEEHAAGRTVVVSTHDLADARRADLVILLANRVVAVGPPDEVLTDEALAAAYGGRVLRLPGGAVMVDDPHHHRDLPHLPEEPRTIGHDHPR